MAQKATVTPRRNGVFIETRCDRCKRKIAEARPRDESAPDVVVQLFCIACEGDFREIERRERKRQMFEFGVNYQPEN